MTTDLPPRSLAAVGRENVDSADPAPLSVTLCIITFRRPVGLRATLQGVGALELAEIKVDLDVLVVDNDAEETARPVVVETMSWFPFPLRYDVEPRRGIPIARNRAIANAGEVDFLSWLDDDEVPSSRWLRSLIETQQLTAADVVIGPSEPLLPPDVDPWIREGGFFERTRFASASSIPANYARTSGVLVRRSAMPNRKNMFDEELRYTGGSDREHFVSMEKSGAKFVWSDEAVVLETVPPSRARARWVLRRAFRTGNSRSITLVVHGASVRQRTARLAKGMVKSISGAVNTVLGLRRGKAEIMRGVWQICYGAGLVCGVLGYRFQEYKRHPGE